MREGLWRVPLAALLAVGMIVGTLGAQDWMATPGAPAPLIGTGPAAAVPPMIDGAPVPGGPPVIVGDPPPGPVAPVPAPPQARTFDGKWFPYGPVEIQASLPPRPPQPVRQWLRKCNIGCYSDIHSAGCGSFLADATFIFGSCHRFYNEPCQGPPLHFPPPAAYNSQGYGGQGCGCGP